MLWRNPVWLLGLIPVFILFAPSNFLTRWRRVTGKTEDGERIAAAVKPGGDHRPGWLTSLTRLRVGALTAAVLALAGTALLLPSLQRHLVVLLDASASCGASQIERARTAALAAIGQLNPGDRAAVAAFARDCRLLVPFTAPDNAAHQLEMLEIQAPGPGQTDLKAAFRFCRQLFRERDRNHESGDDRFGTRLDERGRGREPDSNCSILLCTDGRPTAGGPPKADQMAALIGKGIPVHILPIGLPETALLTQRLDLPEILHPGERMLGEWRAVSAQKTTVIARIRLDGRLLNTRRVLLAQGANQIQLPLYGPAGSNRLTPGMHRVEIDFTGPAGRSITAAACAGLIRVAGPARVLLVRREAAGRSLKKSLEIQGMLVTDTDAAGIPEHLAEFSGYGAVIIDNVPALEITEGQQSAIQSYVAGGGGLLVIGGDASLGRGEYYATGLEDLLPVQTDTRQRLLFNRANVLFMLDHSGSMSELAGTGERGDSKQLQAMRGIAAAIQELNPLDEVAILAFDTQPIWLLPFTPVSYRAQIARALSGAGEGGGTDMAAALREVAREFSMPGPQRRHVIILTDGLTARADFQALCRKLRYYQATVSTIGIGNEIDAKLLRDIARWGGGQFFRARPDQVPAVIRKETVRISRDLIQEGSFVPRAAQAAAAAGGGTAPFLEGLIGKMPAVGGYLITKPKNLGTVYLQVGKGDPLLAGWRYGNGQVFVFASDSGSRWLQRWSGKAVYNRLWSQVVRFIERGAADQGLRVATRVTGATARIAVEAVGPDLRLRQGLQLIGQTGAGLRFGFRETAPGRYETEIPVTGKGIQQFEIAEKQSQNWTMGWIWNGSGATEQALGPDWNFLKEIAVNTGGKIGAGPADPDRPMPLTAPRWVWKPVSLRLFLMVLAVLLFVFELALRSTALGQLRAARLLWAGWWAAQQRLIGLFNSLNRPTAGESDLQNRTTDAYRYLAERARRAREASKDE